MRSEVLSHFQVYLCFFFPPWVTNILRSSIYEFCFGSPATPKYHLCAIGPLEMFVYWGSWPTGPSSNHIVSYKSQQVHRLVFRLFSNLFPMLGYHCHYLSDWENGFSEWICYLLFSSLPLQCWPGLRLSGKKIKGFRGILLKPSQQL